LEHLAVVGVGALCVRALRRLCAPRRVLVGDGDYFDVGKVAPDHVETVAVVSLARAADDGDAIWFRHLLLLLNEWARRGVCSAGSDGAAWASCPGGSDSVRRAGAGFYQCAKRSRFGIVTLTLLASGRLAPSSTTGWSL